MTKYKTGLNTKTFEARATIGKRAGYAASDLSTKRDLIQAIKQASIKANYVFSGTITETDILVTGNNKDYEEPAFLLDTSVYPRFPLEIKEFKDKFTIFIGNLAEILKQERVAIRFSDESLMVETEFCQKPDL